MTMTFHGKSPQIHPTAFVAENASLIGDVTVGKNSSVWFGAVLRGDNGSLTLGEGSNVQDNATLHCEPGGSLKIGNNVTVGHNAVVHCAEVGDNTLIGMGAILMNGARIGKNCVVGAGALVTQNTVAPEGTMLLGVPAKAVKPLGSDAVAKLEARSFYVDLAKEYLREMDP